MDDSGAREHIITGDDSASLPAARLGGGQDAQLGWPPECQRRLRSGHYAAVTCLCRYPRCSKLSYIVFNDTNLMILQRRVAEKMCVN